MLGGELERFHRGAALAGENQGLTFQFGGMHGRFAGSGEPERLRSLFEAPQGKQGAAPDERTGGVRQACDRACGSFLRPTSRQSGARLLGCLLANLRTRADQRRKHGPGKEDCHAVTKGCIRDGRGLHSVGHPSTGAV